MSQNRQQEEDEVENPMMKKLNHLTVSIIQESRPLSISTRAIGFMLAKVTNHLSLCRYDDYSSDDSSERESIKAPLSAMYRVSLAQLEAKVHFAASNQRLFLNPSVHDPSSQYDLQPSSLLYSIMGETWSGHFLESPVSVIINSIGHVQTNGMHYEPKFTKKITPLNLRISNLRKYCEDMANPNTKAEDRKTGYLLNPIPNAQWENENDLESVRLKNPDDIIVAHYDRVSFWQDLAKMSQYLSRMQAKKKLKFGITIDNKRFGNSGILASTHVVPGQSRRLGERNNVQRSYGESTFWSREPLTPYAWSIGVLTLAGEVLNPIDDVPDRSQILAAKTHDGQWQSVSDVLFRNYR